MGFDFRPSSADLESSAYMREYGDQRRLWLAGKAGFDSVADEEGAVQLVERPAVAKGRQVTRIAEKRQVALSDLGTSPARVYRAAVEFGLEARAWLVVNAFAPVLYVSDGDDYSAGDVLHEGYVGRSYIVEAAHMQSRFGFQAHYLGKGAEGKTAGFESARIADPLGILVENWVDYTLASRAGEKDFEREYRIQMGEAMNRRINDGTDRVERVRYFYTGGDFTRWFDEWLVKKDIKPLTPQRKPKATEADLIGGAEWRG